MVVYEWNISSTEFFFYKIDLYSNIIIVYRVSIYLHTCIISKVLSIEYERLWENGKRYDFSHCIESDRIFL